MKPAERTEGITKVGVSRVPGVGIGHAVRWRTDPSPLREAGSVDEERTRLGRAIARAKRGVLDLMRLLPRGEAELFEPELLILDELGTTLRERLVAGMRAEDVVEDGATDTAVDLLMDARARILDALAHDYRSVDALLEGSEGDVVLITETLTPSVVASLPSRVVGIVASSGDSGEKSGSTAHSVILAREREIALALVSTEDLSEIQKNDLVVVDTTEDAAVVSVGPGDEVTQAALAKRHAWNQARDAEAAEAAEPLRQLGVSVLVNVGSVHDRVPASAEGIGLVRTELVFSDHSNAPSEAEQFGVVCAIAALSRRSRAVVRLFDAGGDKPLRWLAPPPGAEAARGIELLGHHPRVLEAQLRAIVRVAHHFDVAVLVPYVRSPRDVADVRARTRGRVPVGALIETTEAVEQIAGIIAASDFVSIGTNDLAASVTGTGRANVGLSLDARLLRMIERVAVACRARSCTVTVCGEIAGNPHGARVVTGLGVHAVSVSPPRVSPIKHSLRGVSIVDCRAIARAAMKTP